MRLINYRTGFASNSSSTHSIYFVKNKNKIEDYFDDYFHEFGWDNFILSSKDLIDKYISSQINYNLHSSLSDDVKLKFIQKFFPNINTLYDVDHQSAWTLPRYINNSSPFPSKKLINDLITYIHNNNIVICGGNDNGDYNEISFVGEMESIINDNLNFYQYQKSVCLKEGNIWKFFNKSSGNKLVFTFDKNANLQYEKSETPELVDLIITNQCNTACSFCYRNCTPNRKYASLNTIKKYIEALIELNVFEIVIGGGDILTYPYLKELIQFLNYVREKADVVFNTTIKLTENINQELLFEVLRNFNGVAFTIMSINDLELFNNLKSKFNCSNNKVSMQLIPELIPLKELNDLILKIKYTDYHLTFLGFKRTGRAKQNINENQINDIHNNLSWLKKAKEKYYGIGVDTQFIKNFPVIKEDAEYWTFREHEGKFSCCIDAAENYISLSSYADEKIPLDVDLNIIELSQKIKKEFQKF